MEKIFVLSLAPMHGGQLIAKTLAMQGVKFVFTLCGGHISPILSGFKQEGVRVVDTRHEVNAVFAADAVFRLSGVPGVAAVTAGPGLTNTITAVKNAQQAQSAIVLLGGGAATVLKGRGSLQDIDQMALMRPHVKWACSIKRVREIVPKIEAAFRNAQEGVPGPVFVECPIDLLYEEDLVREWYQNAGGGKSLQARLLKWYLGRHLNKQFSKSDRVPSKLPVPAAPTHAVADVKRTIKRLRKAERPLVLIGSQAVLQTGRMEELVAAIERLDLPVYLSGMARGLLGPTHPLLNRHKRRLALKESDLVLLAGVPADFRLDYGSHIGRSFLIGVNRSRQQLRLNRKPDIGVLADPGNFLIDLAHHFGESGDSELGSSKPSKNAANKVEVARATWKASLSARNDAREKDIDERAQEQLVGINPLTLFRKLDRGLPQETILVADGGDFVGTASYTLKARGPLTWLDPGAFGTLGVGAGFALGAKLCRPDAEVWIIYGDGSCGYSLAEYDTFTRHKLPVISLVGNDACWAQIARDQVEILKDDVAVMLEHTDYDVVARGFGGEGVRMEQLDELQEVLVKARTAVTAGKSFLINAIIGKSDFRKGSISM